MIHLWLFLLVCGAFLADAKRIVQKVRIGGHRDDTHWTYFNKFGFGNGGGSYGMRLRLVHPDIVPNNASLLVEVFPHNNWNDVEREEICKRRLYARQFTQVFMDGQGRWSDWLEKDITGWGDSHILLFAISDCDWGFNISHVLEIDFYAMQANGSHFSIETQWSLLASTSFLVVMVAHSYSTWQQARHLSRNTDSLHFVIWIFLVSLATQYLSQTIHAIHLWCYWHDGMGRLYLEVISEILFALSQVLLSSLILLISAGYTLLQSDIGSLDVMFPVCFAQAALHVGLVSASKRMLDEPDMFHEFEGRIGWMLLVLKLLLYSLFLWNINSTLKTRGGHLQRFCREFRGIGSMFLLAYPVAFFFANLCSPLWSCSVMRTTMMCLQFGSMVQLGYMLLSSGTYHKASTLGDSMLPGGTKVGYIKAE